ncbi:hypothetical protein GCM10028784_05520 [Myceligenerans cantabricum]
MLRGYDGDRVVVAAGPVVADGVAEVVTCLVLEPFQASDVAPVDDEVDSTAAIGARWL